MTENKIQNFQSSLQISEGRKTSVPKELAGFTGESKKSTLIKITHPEDQAKMFVDKSFSMGGPALWIQ